MSAPIEISTVGQALRGGSTVQKITESNNEFAWLDKIVSIIDKVDNIVSKGSKLGGTVGRLLPQQQDGVDSGQDNPVRSEKIQRRETGVLPEQIQYAKDVPEPKIVERVKEPSKVEIMEHISKEYYNNIIPELIEALDEKLPEDWKQKSVAEIFQIYRELGQTMKGIVNGQIGSEIYALVEGSVDYDKRKKEIASQSTKGQKTGKGDSSGH